MSDPQRVLVTGSSQGIGLGIAERFAVPGAKVGLCARSASDRLEAACDRVRRSGAEVATFLGDLADPDVPSRLVRDVVERFGGLDCVVANAAERSPSLLRETSLESWDRDFDVNVRATWLLAVAAHEALRVARGSIVVVGSVSGAAPHVGMGAYSASKAALEMLTRQMALEWAHDGIRVNIVLPGFTLTPKTREAYREDGAVRDARDAMVPLGRHAEVEEIAAAVEFLAGPQSAYCTGQRLRLDGGLLDSVFLHDPRVASAVAPASKERT